MDWTHIAAAATINNIYNLELVLINNYALYGCLIWLNIRTRHHFPLNIVFGKDDACFFIFNLLNIQLNEWTSKKKNEIKDTNLGRDNENENISEAAKKATEKMQHI